MLNEQETSATDKATIGGTGWSQEQVKEVDSVNFFEALDKLLEKLPQKRDLEELPQKRNLNTMEKKKYENEDERRHLQSNRSSRGEITGQRATLYFVFA